MLDYLRTFQIFFFSLWLLCFWVSGVGASGYAIPPQTAKAEAMGGATVAGIDDPSAVYVNPAGLTSIEGNHILFGATYLNTVGGVKNSGRKSKNIHDDDLIPNLFANYHIPNSNFSLGIGTYAPFGLATSYKPNSFTRYAAIRTQLKTIYVTPAVAWEPLPYLSLGAGISFVHSSAFLSKAIFFGPFGDGRIRITETTNGYAYNLGLLVRPNDQIRLGFSYRSRVNLDFHSADVKFADAAAAGGLSTQSKASGIHVPLPPIINAGINWQVTPRWDIEFQYDFTRWSEFNHLKATFSTPLPGLGGLAPIGGIFIPQRWKDTSAVRLGTSYKLNESYEVRAGIAAEESPVPRSTLGPAIPATDYLSLSAGIGYTWNRLKIDVGYMAVFYKTDRVTNNVLETGGDPSAVPFPGVSGKDKYEMFQSLVGLHFQYRF